MKSLKFTILILFLVSNLSYPQGNPPLKDKFYLGSFLTGYWPPYFDNGIPQEDYYFPIIYTPQSFNLMQSYCLLYDYEPTWGPPYNMKFDGGFYDPISSYSYNLNQMCSRWDQNMHFNSLLLERHKVLRPGYGQRSTYQTEYEPSQLQNGSIRPGYGYITRQVGLTYTETWNNETVSGRKACIACGESPYAGYIVQDLWENREQVNVPGSGLIEPPYGRHDLTYNHSDRKEPGYRWYVKPRMRINQSEAESQTVKRVVRVEVYNFLGNLIDSQTVFTNSFLNSQGHYDGAYLEMFNLPPSQFYQFSFLASDLLQGAETNSMGFCSNITDSQVDYRVYWYGDVNVWLDYVRVDDEWAHFLFEPDPLHKYDFVQKIQEEANFFLNKPGFGYFYMDEHYYNSYPCVSKVNDVIKQVNPNTGLICLFNDNYLDQGGVFKNPPTQPQDGLNFLVTSGAVRDVLITDIYLWEAVADPSWGGNPDGLMPHNVVLPNPVTFPGTARLRNATNAESYNYWLNNVLENGAQTTRWYHTKGYLDRYKRCAQLVKDNPNIVFDLNMHIHCYEDPLANDQEHNNQLTREPTMEEISMAGNLGLAYNAKHISEWDIQSWPTVGYNGTYYSWGLLDLNNKDVRVNNYYSEQKWNGLLQLHRKLKQTGDYIFTQNHLNWDVGLTVNRSGSMPFRYVNDIRSRAPLINGINNCADYDNVNYYDCPEARYWEIGFYLPPSSRDYSRYFHAVNKRCTPNLNNDGDLRELQIKFQASGLPAFVNWKLMDAVSNTLITTFDKNSNQYIIAGTFQPGEGRLLKLVPVIQNGGELVADESVSGMDFDCLDSVWNNGHNITIENTTISFNDSSKIIMDGGTFQIGEQYDNASGVMSKAVTGNHWHGYEFNNCTVKVYNSVFQNLANDTTYAINIINCPYVDIRDNTFIFENDNLKGGVSITYFNSSIGYQIQNLYIGYNTFSSNNSTVPLLTVMSYAGITTPALIEHNSFTTSNTAGSTAIMLNEIVGGAVKSNVIANFELSINALAPSIDIYGNLISSVVANSVGISGLAGSELKLNPTGGIYLGGLNNISNTGTNNKNINIKNSYFLLDGGKNVFNIVNSGSSYHLAGYFPQNGSISLYETENCFKFSGNQTQNPAYNVTDYNGNPLTLQFLPFNCDNDSSCFAGDLGVGDSVWEECGQGGAFSSAVIVTPKTIHDSLCLEMRKRNYPAAVTKAMALLNMFPDSLLSLDAISKLYLAKTRTDTSTASNTALKTFYETLILTHSTNTALVKRCNYFVQKCKVLLRQYSSAMSGFQQIMEQNPYSYDALVAHWDYMATQLIMQGSGGGQSEFDESGESDELGDDKSPFTREQRKQISKTITNIYSETNNQEEKKIEVLKELSKMGDINAGKELEEKNALREAVKPAHPRNIQEHINIVNGDIQKLFAVNKSNGSNENQNLIPDKFSLGQNYPNPFNPLTKIKYGLPRDVKVVIKIYDILGREVKTLVNEFKKAGYYEESFDGSNFATGVYFYRLEAGEFVQSKKMVLIK